MSSPWNGAHDPSAFKMADIAKALHLKEDGNKLYQERNYVGAESLYSKAIIADPSNPTLYTNRAMARMKLGRWDLVIDDCHQALHQDPTNMKAFYQLSQAQLELHDYEASVDSARKAQELALAHNDKSLPNIMNQVRKAIKSWWEDKERRRGRENSELEDEAIYIYRERKEAALRTCISGVERKEVAAEWDNKIALMRDVFERARPKDQRKRDPPPDWLLCDISFQVMLDPVTTRAGHSYDRQNIVEHLKVHPTDPYTRERLFPSDLRPNLALRKACEAYLEENGWAAEY